ncbi:MAG: Hpt domain-containing protein [Alphaproteobacteria bacterium]|nr:Hpt domain-containing protein [Alphaproteobacteria bacterium]
MRPDHAAARFLDDTPPLIDALHSALAAGNLDAARAVAHQLGEGARRLGADQLTALLHEIELLSPRDDAGAAALATAIDGAIARVRESLRREVA